MTKRLGVLAIFSVLLCSPLRADKQPDVSGLPAPVQQRINEWKGEGEVKKIKTRKQRDGAVVYEVEYKERGNSEILVVASDGTVISETAGKGKSHLRGKGKDKKDNKSKADKNKGGKPDDSTGDDNTNPEKQSTEPQKADQPSTRPAPAPAPRTAEPRVVRPATSRTADKPTETITTTPARTNTVARPGSPTVRPLDRRPGETRYIYWDNMPEAVRRMGLAQQAELGSVNAKLLRVQKKAGTTIYHIPYEKGSVSIDESGMVVANVNEHGGPMMLIKWDDMTEAVKKAALDAG